MTGTIVKAISSFYYVEAENKIYETKVRGNLRYNNIELVTGDRVDIEVLDEENRKGVIFKSHKRSNLMKRPPVANITQAILVFSVKSPDPNLSLIDRFLITAMKEHVEIIICFNKIDLDDEKLIESLKANYSAAGYPIVPVSAETGYNVEALRDYLRDNTTIVAGPSGAGKTTCLNILGGMDTLTNGKVIVDGVRIDKLKEKDLIKYRRNDIGFVFQFYNLIQNMNVLENVELATQLCKDSLDPNLILNKVGLKMRKNNFPSQLSGGEQQRVAIARAICKNPKLLLCDEPTGALDYKTGKQILKLLQDTCRNEKMTVIIITHNSAISPMADKIIKFKNGAVSDIIINKTPKNIADIEW